MFGWGAVSTAAQSTGKIYSGFQEAKSLKASAKAKEIEAEETRLGGIWSGIAVNEQSRRLLSTQRAAFGAAGVAVEGSAAQLITNTNRELLLERMMQARNTRMQVASLKADAEELRRAARAAKTKGLLGGLFG